jgi:hypothetical protein
MSGLVPLGVDLLRYFQNLILSNKCLYEDSRWKKRWKLYAVEHGAYVWTSRSEIALQAISFGAQLHTKVSSKVTHLVASTSRTRTTKVKQAARREKIKIVNQQWLLNSMSKWQKEDEEPYLVSDLM